MPGILPMKVIKVGTSSASRIAQACDRCRSKKIRCDGIRPCCSQCSNVGFECRTSDKLSRRAFPRGYTESLEERVRQLESEVRELKDLLDEKDEKIDMLSKMHGNQQRQSSVSRSTAAAAAAAAAASSSPSASPSGSATSASPAPSDASSHKSPSSPSTSSLPSPPATSSAKTSKESSNTKRESPAPKEDTFRIQASPLVLGVENSDSYFMGASSGRSFIDIFKRRMQESGKSCSDFHSEAFLHIQGCYPLVDKVPASAMRAPPRLFSDRCVNVYFQEWSPLFPILHRPAFLRIYDEFVSDADKVKSHHKLAQLYLVFAIAGLSSDQPDLEMIAACEQQWQRSLDAVLMDNTIVTLQCLVLAILYCSMRADYKRLQYYKGVAIGLSHRLGLHQSQKRFSFGALTIETRKKVFWTLYTLDCFSAAVLGLPKQLKDEDIYAEYPADTDDEYVTEKGFQPTLPGESTRLSAALALFRVSRILAKVLDQNYPAASTHELSLQQMSALDAELAEWRDALPQHLTLTFRQEKPSTDVTGNRSPLLSLTYSYIRTLIWRPAVGSSLGHKAGPAVMAISDASKCIVQIVELLEERNMAFSMCINKPDLLVVCGMTLLYQTMDMKQDSKMMKDSERLVNSVLKIAERTKAPGLYDLTRIAALLITVNDMPSLIPTPSSELSMAAPAPRRLSQSNGSQAQSQSQNQKRGGQQHQFALVRHNSASMSESDLLVQQDRLRRATMPVIAAGANANSGGGDASPDVRARDRSSFDSPREHIQLPKQHRLSMSQMSQMSQMAQMSQMSPMSHMSQMPQMVSRMTSTQQQQQQQRLKQKKKSNLDYLNMSSQSPQPAPSSPVQPRMSSQPTTYYTATTQSQKASSPSAVTPADWEALLGSMDGGHMNVYDAIYGGPNIGLSSGTDATPASAASQSGDGWSPEAWELSGFMLSDIAGAGGKGGDPSSVPAPAQSVLSFSDESMGSVSVAGDELNAADLANLGLGGLDISGLPYRSTGSLLNPACSTGPESFAVDSLENNFVL